MFSTIIPLPANARGSFTATASAYGAKPDARTCRAATTVTIEEPPCEEPCLPATGAESLPLASVGLAGVAVGIALLVGARFRMSAGRAAQFALIPAIDAPLPPPRARLVRMPREPGAPVAQAPVAPAAPAPPRNEPGAAGPSGSSFDRRMQSYLSELARYSE